MIAIAQLDRLGHILESGRVTVAYLEGLDRAAFNADRRTQDAVIRRLTILGEACVRLGPEFHAAHPAVPWREMRGMRNFVVHAYEQVDLTMVWDTASQDVPALLSAVEAIFTAEGLPIPT